MNENSPMENELAFWKPRDPSPRVKAAVFGNTKPAAQLQANRPVSPLVWMTPAACAVMMCVFLRLPHAVVADGFEPADGSNLVASLSSNLVRATEGGKEYQSQNVWHEVTFEWTRDPKSPSTRGSFPFGNTNTQKL